MAVILNVVALLKQSLVKERKNRLEEANQPENCLQLASKSQHLQWLTIPFELRFVS